MRAAKNTVVVFAYHFPPENVIGARRPFRFVKYLSKLGYDCRVFTAAPQAGQIDTNVHYVPDPFVTRARHSFQWQLERGVRKLFLPGHLGTMWSYHAARAASSYVRRHSREHVTIFSTYPPLGSHFAGWQLSRNRSFRWIADFRDPLGDERMQQGMSFLPRRVSQWLESLFVRRADAVIANTDAARLRLQKKFPESAEKIQLIWNGFDPEDRILPLPIPVRPHKEISHVGEIYAGRNVTPILESFARLITAQRLPIGRVKVRLIGPAETSCLPSQAFIDQAKADGWLDLVTSQISQQDAGQITRRSDSLLLVEPLTSLRAPAKLFEYLQIGRPILAFVEPNSSSEQLLKKAGVPYRCVYPSSTPEAIDDAVVGFFDLQATAVMPSSWFEHEFNAENQTKKLDNLICSLRDAPTV